MWLKLHDEEENGGVNEFHAKRRCKHRASDIAWCNKLKKFCNAPFEYDTCKHYEPKN